MSVIKLDKDVLIYSPIAATPNCIDQVEAAVGSKPTHIIMQVGTLPFTHHHHHHHHYYNHHHDHHH